MSTYICLYNGKKFTIEANTTLTARDLAAKYFKTPKGKLHMISVLLANVEHNPAIL